jgi:DedD protein
MSLSSIFQRFRQQATSESAVDATPVSPASVEEARVKARRRLIGMAVLVGVGVIGFPWLFETQPRPMLQDIQVVQARGTAQGEEEGLAVTGAGRPTRSAAGKVSVAAVEPAQAEEEPHEASPEPRKAAPKPAEKPVEKPVEKPAEKTTAKQADKGLDKPGVKPVVKPADKAQPKLAEKPAEKPVAKATDKASDKPVERPAAKVADKAKPADKDASRYVVQVGAFAESASAQATRSKIERLGVKTYAQEVSTPAGKRIRVRIGPYTDKAEADKALATLRKAGVNGAVLTL